jgi:hypothetical protein
MMRFAAITQSQDRCPRLERLVMKADNKSRYEAATLSRATQVFPEPSTTRLCVMNV